MSIDKEKLIPLIKAKGFNAEFFNPLNEAIAGYKEHVQFLHLLREQMQITLKADKYDCRNPIESYEVERLMKEKIKSYTYAVLMVVGDKFKNISFNGKEVEKFVESQKEFDANEIMFFLFDKYARDEDLVALTQIQNSIKDALPCILRVGAERRGEPERVEELTETSKNGLKFWIGTGHDYNIGSYSIRNRMSSIVKFVEIVIGKVKPSEAKGGNFGDTFSNEQIKTFIQHKNYYATLTFKNAKDKKAFSEALFIKPEELVKMLF